MKTNTFIIVCLLTINILTAEAQHKINLIYGGGINLFVPKSPKMFNENQYQIMYLFTVHPGFSGNYKFNISYNIFKNLYIGTGINFIGKTAEFENLLLTLDDEITYKASSELKYNYLEVPFFVEYEFFKDKKIIPFVHFGTAYDKLQCAKEQVLSVEKPGTEYYFENYILNYNSQLDDYKNNDMLSVNAETGLKYVLKDNLLLSAAGGVKTGRFIKNAYDVRLSGYLYYLMINLTLKI